MCDQIKVGNFIAERNEKGEWLYKADQVKPFKKDGNLKAQYRDLPRFKAIMEYETVLNKQYQKTVIEQATKQIINKLLSF